MENKLFFKFYKIHLNKQSLHGKKILGVFLTAVTMTVTDVTFLDCCNLELLSFYITYPIHVEML